MSLNLSSSTTFGIYFYCQIWTWSGVIITEIRRETFIDSVHLKRQSWKLWSESMQCVLFIFFITNWYNWRHINIMQRSSWSFEPESKASFKYILDVLYAASETKRSLDRIFFWILIIQNCSITWKRQMNNIMTRFITAELKS